jgi:hypothetical protein
MLSVLRGWYSVQSAPSTEVDSIPKICEYDTIGVLFQVSGGICEDEDTAQQLCRDLAAKLQCASRSTGIGIPA